MLLICPQCETIFRVDRLRLHPSGQPVHYMIFDHIRIARLLTTGDRQDMSNIAPDLSKFRLPPISKSVFVRFDIGVGAKADVSIPPISRLIFD